MKSSTRKLVQSSFNEDRISNLPDDCLHHILSYVDVLTLVQSSVLSKRWRHLWKRAWGYIHSLYFTNPRIPKANKKLLSDKFMTYVDRVLVHVYDKTKIKSIQCNSEYECDSSRVAHWIYHAGKLGVEELRLCILFNESRLQLYLPDQKFKVFELIAVKRVLSFRLCNALLLYQLQSLHFELVDINNAAQIVKIVANCPFLETLVLRDCTVDVTELCISSLTLQNLVLEKIVRDGSVLHIKIRAPNLISLALAGDFSRNSYNIENVTSLVKADLGIAVKDETGLHLKELNAMHMMELLTYLENVKELNVREPCWIEVMSRQTMPHLRCVQLNVWFHRSCMAQVELLLRSSPQIETLILKRLEYTGAGQTNFGLEFYLEGTLDNLKTIEIKDFEATCNELEFLKALLRNALVLEKIRLSISLGYISDVRKTIRKKELQKLARASPSILVSAFHPKTSMELMKFYI